MLLFFAGLMCFNFAIGEYAKLLNNTLSFDNACHRFRYLRLLMGEVTQFRVIARFNWVCFWAFNFSIIYLLDRFFERHSSLFLRGLLIVFVSFSVVDMFNMQTHLQTQQYQNPFTDQELIQPIEHLLKDLEPQKYQAVLPLPFYLLGSEIPDMMLSPNDDWETQTAVFSLASGLPLMSSHFTRSAIVQHEALLSIFTNEGINDYLKAHLDKRPILVFMTNETVAWNMNFNNESLQNYLEYGKKVPNQYNMKLLKTAGNYQLWEWKVE